MTTLGTTVHIETDMSTTNISDNDLSNSPTSGQKARTTTTVEYDDGAQVQQVGSQYKNIAVDGQYARPPLGSVSTATSNPSTYILSTWLTIT